MRGEDSSKGFDAESIIRHKRSCPNFGFSLCNLCVSVPLWLTLLSKSSPQRHRDTEKNSDLGHYYINSRHALCNSASDFIRKRSRDAREILGRYFELAILLVPAE